jgi:hypothetical protein
MVVAHVKSADGHTTQAHRQAQDCAYAVRAERRTKIGSPSVVTSVLATTVLFTNASVQAPCPVSLPTTSSMRPGPSDAAT